MTIDDKPTPLGESNAQTPTEGVAAPDFPEMHTPSPDIKTHAGAEVSEEPAVPDHAEHAPAEAAVAVEDHAPSVQEPEIAVPEPETPSFASEPDRREPAAATEAEGVATSSGEVASESESGQNTKPAEVERTEPPVEVQPAAASSQRAADEDANLFEAAMIAMETGEGTEPYEGSFKKLNRGDRIEATVIQVERDRVFVDLGTKSEGIVPLSELSEDNLESAKDHFKIGDKINVVVIRPEGAESNPIVSKRRADFEEIWDRIETAFKSEEMITAQVVDRVKGGLVVDVGVRGFVPATHVGNGKLRNIEKYVGQPLQLKVIEIDRERKKVVLSNRQAEEQRRASAKDDIFNNVSPGDSLDGTVRRLTDYGAFVDLGGVDGLLHISEMSWMRINHPREMFKEGQKIKVMVLRLDAAAGKISLGHRQVLPDPWNLIKQNYTVGQKITVHIGRLVQSGAFVKLPEGAEAFMPISEMSFRRIKRPDEAVEEGQEIEVQIIDLRTEERRMVLSLRATGTPDRAPRETSGMPPSDFGDEMRGDKRAKAGKKGKKGGRGRGDEDDFDESVGMRGFATGGATIGERLGMLKGFLNRDEEEEDSSADADHGHEEGEAVVGAEHEPEAKTTEE